jgi:hypothetical protein
VNLPAFTDELFPQDIASMLKSRLTFKDAIENASVEPDEPAPSESGTTGLLLPTGQPGHMNDGVDAFRLRLQKEFGHSNGPMLFKFAQ